MADDKKGMTPEEELEWARKRATIESNRRKISYANVESDILKQDKKMEAIALLFMIANKYNITKEDMITLMENIPHI